MIDPSDPLATTAPGPTPEPTYPGAAKAGISAGVDADQAAAELAQKDKRARDMRRQQEAGGRKKAGGDPPPTYPGAPSRRMPHPPIPTWGPGSTSALRGWTMLGSDLIRRSS